MKINTFLLICTLTINCLFSQCPNLGFKQGDFTNWVGTVSQHPGGRCNGDSWTGILPYIPDNTRFVTFNDVLPVFDDMTCNTLERTPPGKKSSARVGNHNHGGEQDKISYTMSVTPSNNFLLYEYACIVQEPNVPGGNFPPHDEDVRPAFTIEVRDNAGNLIGPDLCNKIEEWANPEDIGLRTCDIIDPNYNEPSMVYYRPWTKIGVDLRTFQLLPAPLNEVTISFTSLDCGLCGHFGYGYVYAECNSLEINAEFCEGNDFAVLTAPDGFSYLWENGQTTQQILLNNVVEGQNVWVDLITIGGCSSRLETTLKSSKTTAQFTLKENACVDEVISFNHTSFANYNAGGAIPITSVLWDFGDGVTSNSPNPTHAYIAPNVYNVTLTVKSEKGCIDVINKVINISDIPQANFEVAKTCKEEKVFFTDLSTLAVGNLSWKWNFGDITSPINTSALQNPTHVYNQVGEYQVTLEVESNYGCINTIQKTITIHNNPIANFDFDLPCKDAPTIFDDASVGNNLITKWKWNFGDGALLSDLQNPNHTYNSSGIFNVELEVENEFGCIDNIAKEITVHDVLVDFNSGFTCVDQLFTFISSATKPLVSYYWNFDDGTTSVDQNPQKAFSLPGFYNVSFTGESIDGCRNTIVKQIQVYDLPIPSFVADNNSGCKNICIQFTNTSYSAWDISEFYWNFGDGNTSIEENPLHCYELTGKFDVTLTLTSIKGCINKITYPSFIETNDLPIANFDLNPNELNIHSPKVHLVNTSIGASSILWQIDSLKTLKDNVIDYTFSSYKSKVYEICLEAFSNLNCKDTICKKVKTKGHLLYTPNAFSPNNDGFNDSFIPKLLGIGDKNYNFYIFNRWGELIYTTKNQNEGWDGKHKGKLVKEDVYVWKVEARTENENKRITKTGHVSVLRKK